jgi:DUF438 domain-containing protein
MSELINQSKIRQELLKKIIRGIHEDGDVEKAKAEFKKHFSEVSTEEISQMEQALIREGMAIEEVQRLCDVHVSVFEGAISDIHPTKDVSKTLGHPVQVFVEENDRIEQLIHEEIEPYLDQKGPTAVLMLRVAFDRLQEIHHHYARKEYLFFPNLEKKGITAPPKVMWAVDDEIRQQIKKVQIMLGEVNGSFEETKALVVATIQKVRDMISKENDILIPLLIDTLSFFDWVVIDGATPEIGYFLEKPIYTWKAEEPKAEVEEQGDIQTHDMIALGVGRLNHEQLEAMLNTLPLDLTFVDADNKVRYFTQGQDRIFDRPSTIIGRDVSMCHPPASVHVVEAIVDDFRNGRKDHEDFWLHVKGMFVHIRYYAVRNKDNAYLGTLEVTQDIQPLIELEGEKRLRSE